MAGIQIDGVNNKIDFDDDADTSISANTDDKIVVEAGGTNTLFVNNGTVGITNEPDLGSGLHIKTSDSGASVNASHDELVIEANGNSGIAILSSTSNAGAICFGDSGNNCIGYLNYDHASDSMQFGVNNAERMRFASDGDMFIGATSNFDGEILRANVDGTNNIASFTSSNNGGAGQITITNSFSASASTDETATVRFGLGNGGAAMQAFKVSDTQTAANRDVGLQFKVQQDNAEAVRFQISSNGDLTATDTSIGSISDVRLKKDIEDLTYSIDTFKALKPRTFNWKNPWLHGEETNRRGFVAQELKEVDPYWVSQQKAVKKSDDVLDPATYYEEGDEIPEDKEIGDIKTEATYTYQYEKGDGSDYDLLNDGSELDNIEMIAKLGKKDAMYISVIQQLIARIEALEGN